MDRIDLRIEVPAVTGADLICRRRARDRRKCRAGRRARDLQLAALHCRRMSGIRTNAESAGVGAGNRAQPDANGLKLLRDAAETMRLSARGYHRVPARCPHVWPILTARKNRPALHLAEGAVVRRWPRSRRAA